MNTKIMPQSAIKKTSKENEVMNAEVADFKIEHLFGSKTRVRLMNLFLEHPERPLYVREVTRKIDAQLNSVRRELQNLIELGILKEIEGKIIDTERDEDEKELKKTDKKKYYVVNQACPFFEELRGIMKKSAVMMNRSLVKQLEKEGRVDLLILTGRFIDNDSVASDILVIGEIDPEKLQNAIGEFEKELAREINYTYMPREEYTYRAEVKDRFLMSLLETDKVVLVNKISANI